ncbi:serine hydrolase domain-containing protein [Maribacter sp. HTCC2170]|uniref:serine hydrolase domain-containing protein n=1 Tax=Maribacter sp. (strain HTCC2170 / KCCM 42371) TaxID=313603 RepID=UPI00006B1B5A|nr:serine hydrolase domain-containing protein [Maribacter sp. HTCC2170]EAR00825.1 FmtA-like protein [Maribacter sp. HTCC2170]
MKSILTYLNNLFSSESNESLYPNSKGLAKADDLLNSLIEEKRIPGLAITVLKEGKTIFQKGYGYADLEEKIVVDPQRTIFRIASVSKNIAATALAHMVKDGVIDLDASLYNYVPFFPKKEYDFTIRQLAGHTAGIRGYKGKEYGLNKLYSIKDSLEIFKDDDLLFKPGSDYHYNSFDWVLISLAMQEVSGVSFEEYVREKVLIPLGLSNTFSEAVWLSGFETLEQGVRYLSSFYSKSRLGFRKAIPVNNDYKLAGGGYVSTSEDIAKFGQFYLDNEIRDNDVISEFLTSQIVNGKPTYYGLGWQVSEDSKGRRYFGHIGNGVGGYSNLFVYPNEQIVLSILANCTNPRIQKELDESIDQIICDS